METAAHKISEEASEEQARKRDLQETSIDRSHKATDAESETVDQHEESDQYYSDSDSDGDDVLAPRQHGSDYSDDDESGGEIDSSGRPWEPQNERSNGFASDASASDRETSRDHDVLNGGHHDKQDEFSSSKRYSRPQTAQYPGYDRSGSDGDDHEQEHEFPIEQQAAHKPNGEHRIKILQRETAPTHDDGRDGRQISHRDDNRSDGSQHGRDSEYDDELDSQSRQSNQNLENGSRASDGEESDRSVASEESKEEKRKKLRDPRYVPRGAEYYDHDDRSAGVGKSVNMKQTQKRPQKRNWNIRRTGSSGRWKHDKFEQLMREPRVRGNYRRPLPLRKIWQDRKAWKKNGGNTKNRPKREQQDQNGQQNVASQQHSQLRNDQLLTNREQDRINMQYQKKLRRRQRQKARRRAVKQQGDTDMSQKMSQTPPKSPVRQPPSSPAVVASQPSSPITSNGSRRSNRQQSGRARRRNPRKRLEYRPKVTESSQSKMNPNAKEFTLLHTQEQSTQSQTPYGTQNGDVGGNVHLVSAPPVTAVMAPAYQHLAEPSMQIANGTVTSHSPVVSSVDANGAVVYSQSQTVAGVTAHEEGGTVFFSQAAAAGVYPE